MSTKNSNEIIWDRTSDLPICSTIRKRVSRKKRPYRKKPEHKKDERKGDRRITKEQKDEFNLKSTYDFVARLTQNSL